MHIVVNKLFSRAQQLFKTLFKAFLKQIPANTTDRTTLAGILDCVTHGLACMPQGLGCASQGLTCELLGLACVPKGLAFELIWALAHV